MLQLKKDLQPCTGLSPEWFITREMLQTEICLITSVSYVVDISSAVKGSMFYFKALSNRKNFVGKNRHPVLL